jgi:hypothetical protein
VGQSSSIDTIEPYLEELDIEAVDCQASSESDDHSYHTEIETDRHYQADLAPDGLPLCEASGVVSDPFDLSAQAEDITWSVSNQGCARQATELSVLSDGFCRQTTEPSWPASNSSIVPEQSWPIAICQQTVEQSWLAYANQDENCPLEQLLSEMQPPCVAVVPMMMPMCPNSMAPMMPMIPVMPQMMGPPGAWFPPGTESGEYTPQQHVPNDHNTWRKNTKGGKYQHRQEQPWQAQRHMDQFKGKRQWPKQGQREQEVPTATSASATEKVEDPMQGGPKFCEYCGKGILPHFKFCQFCGASLAKTFAAYAKSQSAAECSE